MPEHGPQTSREVVEIPEDHVHQVLVRTRWRSPCPRAQRRSKRRYRINLFPPKLFKLKFPILLQSIFPSQISNPYSASEPYTQTNLPPNPIPRPFPIAQSPSRSNPSHRRPIRVIFLARRPHPRLHPAILSCVRQTHSCSREIWLADRRKGLLGDFICIPWACGC